MIRKWFIAGMILMLLTAAGAAPGAIAEQLPQTGEEERKLPA